MATKKQKRAAALAKREAFMEEHRLSGLEAQKNDRKYREQEKRKTWRKMHEGKHTPRNIVEGCPHCVEMVQTDKRWERHAEKAPDGTYRTKRTAKEKV